VLDSLKQKGLVSEIPEKSRIVYAAENPESLEQNVKHSLSDFHELLPILKASYNRGSKPSIRYYDDKDVIYNLYLNEIFPAEKVYFYGSSIKNITEIWPDLLDKWDNVYWPKKKKHPENILELVDNEEEDIKWAKSQSKHREVRIVPKGKNFLADSAIADDKIMITSLDPLFAIIIESPTLAQTYRSIAELAWESSIPAEKWKD
jgi:sugar-specific transcriptional regulator TrmB